MTLFRKPRKPIIEAPRSAWTGRLLTVTYTVLAAGLLFQPRRFHRTPSYGNLDSIMNFFSWGWVYLLGAVMLGWYIWSPWSNRAQAIIAHTYLAGLTLLWDVAFVIRWYTDDATTAVNIVSWTVFFVMVLRSGVLIDEFLADREARTRPNETS